MCVIFACQKTGLSWRKVWVKSQISEDVKPQHEQLRRGEIAGALETYSEPQKEKKKKKKEWIFPDFFFFFFGTWRINLFI